MRPGIKTWFGADSLSFKWFLIGLVWRKSKKEIKNKSVYEVRTSWWSFLTTAKLQVNSESRGGSCDPSVCQMVSDSIGRSFCFIFVFYSSSARVLVWPGQFRKTNLPSLMTDGRGLKESSQKKRFLIMSQKQTDRSGQKGGGSSNSEYLIQKPWTALIYVVLDPKIPFLLQICSTIITGILFILIKRVYFSFITYELLMTIFKRLK